MPVEAVPRLAHALVEAGLDLDWAAEVRLERSLSRERCEALRRSGCVAVSVGFESGCQRILDRIQKGTRLDEVARTVQAFASVGIAVQMMGFMGFPTASPAEALESVADLERTSADWTVCGLGEFALTPGSIVAQHPQEFGVLHPRARDGDDVPRVLMYEDAAGPWTSSARQEVEAAQGRLNRAEFDRPFAGGIDTAHSLFDYARFGRDFPVRVTARGPAADDPIGSGRPLILRLRSGPDRGRGSPADGPTGTTRTTSRSRRGSAPKPCDGWR